MIGLRPEDDVDMRRAAQNVLAFRLSDATADGDEHESALGRPVRLEPAQPAEIGVHFLGRLLADVTRVEDDHVGTLGTVTRQVAERRQNLRHARGVVGVHLATVRFYEEFLRHRCITGGRGRDGPARIRDSSMLAALRRL